MLSASPANRPSISEALGHVWFDETAEDFIIEESENLTSKGEAPHSLNRLVNELKFK